jgi:hypothetical protein
MNDQLTEQLQEWNPKEWERHLRRYVEANHNPDAPENRIHLRPALEKPGANSPRAGNMSWRFFNRAMGVETNYTHPLELSRRAA